MPHPQGKAKTRQRRIFSEEFKQEAVQMLLDGHSASSVAERLGLAGSNVLYRWKSVCGLRESPNSTLKTIARRL